VSGNIAEREGTMTMSADTAWIKEKIALVFPGQGTQHVGMGRYLYEHFPAARAVIDQADAVLGYSLSKLMFEGPADELEDTLNAQPAILTMSVAALEALREQLSAVGQKLQPVYVAGHSLGEYSALVAAGSLEFRDALRLVRERGRLMKEAGTEFPGGMAAVLGLEPETLAAVCEQASRELDGIVVVANDNCPGQTVISGESKALERAMELALEHGARRAVRLDISIASHSPLMERAARQLGELVNIIDFREPVIPIVSNLTGRVSTSVEEVRRNAGNHMIRPVMWTNSVREMIDSGTTTFVEIGPGNVLGGLIRRVKRDAKTITLADLHLHGN
jgi:[acyl-carrier-protein] S-malonyltransferase